MVMAYKERVAEWDFTVFFFLKGEFNTPCGIDRIEVIREILADSKGMVTFPYMEGTAEKVQRIFKKYNIATTVRPTNTLKSISSSKGQKGKP